MKALGDHNYALGFSKPMSNPEYHLSKGLSSSRLRTLISKSPAHMQYQMLNPEPPTAAMQFGTHVHTAVLEPELFLKNVAIFPGKTRYGKAWDDFNAASEGKIVLKKDELDQIREVQKSVLAHKTAAKLLENAHNELSFFARDVELGIDLKCRPDVLREGHIIVDLKTTTDASLKGFQRSIASFGYHQQAAFYLDVMSMVTGANYDKFVIIAVEKEAPHAVAVYALDDATIEAGRFINRKGLELYSRCLETGIWPAYSGEIVPMNLPSYAWPQE